MRPTKRREDSSAKGGYGGVNPGRWHALHGGWGGLNINSYAWMQWTMIGWHGCNGPW